jgi:hypothetical protein
MVPTPNALAFASLLAWPILTLGLFLVFSTRKAVALSFVFGMLFLPERTEIVMPLEDFGKREMVSLAVLLGVLMKNEPRVVLQRQVRDAGDRRLRVGVVGVGRHPHPFSTHDIWSRVFSKA